MIELNEILYKNLSINPKYCSKTPITQIVECFSCGQWLRSIRREVVFTPPPLHSYLTPDEVQSALQLGETIGETWQKVLIQILPKENRNVFTLPKHGTESRPTLLNQMSYFQILQYVSESNIKSLWEDSYQRYENHAVIKQWKEGQKSNLKPHKIVLKSALLRLYKCPLIPIDGIDLEEDEGRYIPKDGVNLNIHPALFIIEGHDHYFVFMKPSSYSVWDCVNFSPAKFKDNEYGALFILHQLLEGMQVIEDCGLFVGNITLHHLRLGSDFLLTIIPQITDSLLEPEEARQRDVSVSEGKISSGALNRGNKGFTSADHNENNFLSLLSCSDAKNAIEQMRFEDSEISLLQLTQKWVIHAISNFDYLLCLSYFAGHSFQSPVYYPILPWVIDFTSPNAGWRDLTRTKYRLNKGDQQLNHTYELMENDPHVDQIAHHIPEFFSEVTYYVYKARVTPKIILKKHVRQQFVSSHYPSTIARMYALTPEECIPEFYCDPSIFKSIHEDLPDLEVPSWCEGVEDFLRMHRAALESNYVSRRLHHWIDLYYGYKLTGSASVKAKNVCLPLVDDHSTLSKGGIVQLFNTPHPPKLTPSPFLSKLPPLPHLSEWRETSLKQSKKCTVSIDEMENVFKEDDPASVRDSASAPKGSKSSTVDEKSSTCLKKIELPQNYNPLTSLNQVEMLYNFFLKTSGKLPDKLNKDDSSSYSLTEALQLRRVKDIQILGCLIVQIFSAPRNRIISSKSCFEEVYSLALKILQEPNDIPNCLHNALQLIFQIGGPRPKLDWTKIPPKFSAVSDFGLPAPSCDQMLQPLINTINFPITFSFLSSFVKNMKSYSNVLEDYYFASDNKKEEFIKNLTEKHIKRTASDLREIVLFLSFDGLKLILPYIVDLYSNPLSAVCSAWYFTDIITQALGPAESIKYILPLLIKLFEVESVSKDRLKLFHKTFLLQLMIRFRLKTFLKHFVTPIIEGAGGYKAPVEGSGVSPLGILRKKSKSLRNPRTGFRMEDQKQASPCEENLLHQSKSESLEQTKYFNRRSSSIRSPSGAENDITDAENDTEIFVFEGGEDEDTLNDFGGNTAMDMNDSLKSPISDTVSLEEESLQDGGGSIPSLCPSPHSPTLSGGEMEEHLINDDSVCGTRIKSTDSSSGIPIPHSKLLESCSKTHFYSSSLPEKPIDSKITYSTKDSRPDTKPFNDIQPVLRINSLKDNFKEHDSNVSLAEICCENVMWLSHRLGPVLTAKHITRNLLRMLSLCYLPESGYLAPVLLNSDYFSVTRKEILGDNNASKILYCLMEIADLYGEQVILLQYLSHITELVSWCGNKLSTSQEAGLIGAMTLLQHLLMKLSDVTFMDYLQETLIRNAVYPVIRLFSSLKVYFPNGVAVRSILAWRVIDSLCLMIQRVGREMSKEKLTPAITRFLTAFDKVHSLKWHTLQWQRFEDKIEDNPDYKSRARDLWNDKEKALEDLKNVFTPELAYLSYVPLCRFLGTKYMEDSLPNHDLLRSLCLQYDESKQADFAADLTFDGQSSLEHIQGQSDLSFATNVAVTGNRIDIKDPSEDVFGRTSENVGLEPSNFDFNISKRAENKTESVRHLRGNWLAYWEHEIGRSEQEESFVFKQIKLQTFVGHSNSVKSLYLMDNENSFMSCSKDKTVKLWSLRSQGDGNAESGPQWTYSNHKKSVFDVVFCEPLRLAASCDSTVHIWDPFTGTCLKQLDSLRHSPVTVLTSVSAPSKQLITATTDSTLKFIDLRTCTYTHELKITTSSVGLVRCLATSGDSHLVAVAHSSGVIATLDLRTGHILATWKPHEGEVLTLQWYEKGTFISSALDQTICVWSVYDNKLKFLLKGPSEPVHLLRTFGNEVLTGTTANRIGLHTMVSPNASFSCTRLRTDAFKGVLTAMGILPLNRQLLLGADNGTIKLLC